MDPLLLKIVFMFFALGCGWFFLFVYSVFVRNDERQTLVERLEEQHENECFAEMKEREAALMKAGAHEQGSLLWNYYMDCHQQLIDLHQSRWNERVAEIVNLEVRISEAEQAELDRGADWREAVEQ